MTSLALRYDASETQPTPRAKVGDKPATIFQRIGAALYAAQTRRAEREIAQLLAQNGGLLTDDLERQISRRYGRIVGQ